MQKYIGVKLVAAAPETRDNTPGWRVIYDNGYVSWSPVAAFDAAHQPANRLSFGRAFEALRMGYTVRRASWSETTHVFRVDEPERTPREAIMIHLVWSGVERIYEYLPSQLDLTANDWQIIFANEQSRS